MRDAGINPISLDRWITGGSEPSDYWESDDEQDQCELMAKTKQLCEGCRNDYYNRNREGGCWSFATAKVVKLQRVGIWQPPPYPWHPETRLSCYHAEGYSMLPKSDPRIKPKREKKK